VLRLRYSHLRGQLHPPLLFHQEEIWHFLSDSWAKRSFSLYLTPPPVVCDSRFLVFLTRSVEIVLSHRQAIGISRSWKMSHLRNEFIYDFCPLFLLRLFHCPMMDHLAFLEVRAYEFPLADGSGVCPPTPLKCFPVLFLFFLMAAMAGFGLGIGGTPWTPYEVVSESPLLRTVLAVLSCFCGEYIPCA